MTIERDGYNGPITFHCDGANGRCAEVDETHCENFSGAMAKAKSHGWKSRNVNDEWLHFCPDHAA